MDKWLLIFAKIRNCRVLLVLLTVQTGDRLDGKTCEMLCAENDAQSDRQGKEGACRSVCRGENCLYKMTDACNITYRSWSHTNC